MKTIRRLILTGAMAAMIIAAPQARGQSTSPGASAQELVNQAVAAFQKAGSAHVNSTVKAAVTGANAGQFVLDLQGDVAWRSPAAAHLTGMVSLGLAGMSQPLAGMPVELAYANKQMAVRAGAQTWSCRSVQAPSTSSGVPAGTVHFQAPVNLGAETLNGVAVWHVRDTGTAVLEQKPQTITVDLYIAQASHSLLRLVNTSNGSVGKNAMAETSSVDFSKYGEAVSVTLPVACRSSGSAGLTSQLVQKMSLLLNPRALLRHLRRPVH